MHQNDIKRGIVRDVVKRLDDYESHDEATEDLVEMLAKYIVEGWWTLCDGDMKAFEDYVVEQRDRAMAWICSMISMAHAIRSGRAEEWAAETTGA